MKVRGTMNAGYSPKFGFEVVKGQEYDIPEQESLPEFFEAATPPKTAEAVVVETAPAKGVSK